MQLAQAIEQYDYSELEGVPQMALTVEQVEALVNELADYHALYSPFFQREEQASWG